MNFTDSFCLIIYCKIPFQFEVSLLLTLKSRFGRCFMNNSHFHWNPQSHRHQMLGQNLDSVAFVLLILCVRGFPDRTNLGLELSRSTPDSCQHPTAFVASDSMWTGQITSCWHRVCCGDVCALWPNCQPSGKRPEAHQHLVVLMQRFPLWKLQWGLGRSAHISQMQSLRNSRQDVINIQDKMDGSVFILKVEDRWIRFFSCWKLQAGVFPCRANTSIKTKQADSQPTCLAHVVQNGWWYLHAVPVYISCGAVGKIWCTPASKTSSFYPLIHDLTLSFLLIPA